LKILGHAHYSGSIGPICWKCEKIDISRTVWATVFKFGGLIRDPKANVYCWKY